MTIREAGIGDVERLHEIWQELMRLHIDLEPHLALNDKAGAEHRKFLKADMEDNRYHLLLAEEDDEIMGYCLAEIQDDPPIFEMKQHVYIHDMAITMKHRRKGVATALFDAMKQWVWSRDIEHIRLDIVHTNPMSSKFWSRMGFKEFTRTLYVDLDQPQK